jgi:hypothetical protein
MIVLTRVEGGIQELEWSELGDLWIVRDDDGPYQILPIEGAVAEHATSSDLGGLLVVLVIVLVLRPPPQNARGRLLADSLLIEHKRVIHLVSVVLETPHRCANLANDLILLGGSV